MNVGSDAQREQTVRDTGGAPSTDFAGRSNPYIDYASIDLLDVRPTLVAGVGERSTDGRPTDEALVHCAHPSRHPAPPGRASQGGVVWLPQLRRWRAARQATT